MERASVFRWMISCIVLTVVPLAGCNRLSQEEVTDSSNLWGGYTRGAVFELKHDVFLIKLTDAQQGTRYALSPPGTFDHPDRFYTVPNVIDQYEGTNGSTSTSSLVTGRSYQIPTTTVGVIKIGTRVRSTTVTKRTQWTWFFGQTSWTTVFGEILDGPFSGKLVDMTDLSIRKKTQARDTEVAVYEPNLQLLDYSSSSKK